MEGRSAGVGRIMALALLAWVSVACVFSGPTPTPTPIALEEPSVLYDIVETFLYSEVPTDEAALVRKAYLDSPFGSRQPPRVVLQVDSLWYGRELDLALRTRNLEREYRESILGGADCWDVTYVVPVEPDPVTGLPETGKAWLWFAVDLRTRTVYRTPRRQFGLDNVLDDSGCSLR